MQNTSFCNQKRKESHHAETRPNVVSTAVLFIRQPEIALIQGINFGSGFAKNTEYPLFHVVVLVPSLHDGVKKPYMLRELSSGHMHQKDCPHDLITIARLGALQLWYDLNYLDKGVIPQELPPHVMPLWGGVKRDGIVVVCAGGVKPWFNRLIAGIVADICIANAYDKWVVQSPDKDSLYFMD